MSAPVPAEVEEVDPLVGRVVEGRFQVVRKIAAGGMGVVYEATQVPLGRRVALKVLEVTKTPATDASFKERFFLEASAAARLAHPNTIVVHDYGSTADGLCFIAMEYLDGGTLSSRLKASGPLAPQEAIHVGLQIASSLREAHQQGLVHRDLKPGNVMFAPRGGDPLFVKVLDFGLVKVLDQGKDALQLTQSGVMMGSPRYMAPEQVKAQSTDARTDIYSFGAVLYHALTGAPPFHAGSAFEAMQHHVYTPAPPLRQAWPSCPAGPMLEAVVARCLAKEPSARFQSMDELMNALRDAAAEAGGGLSGVGSYLGRPTSASGSGPDSGPYAPPAFGESPSSPSNPGSGPIAQSGIVARTDATGTGRVKTVRFDAPAEPPVAPSVVAAPSRGGGGVGLVVAGAALALLCAGALVAAIVILLPAADGASPAHAAGPPPEPAPAIPAPAPTPAPAPAPTQATQAPAPARPVVTDAPALHLETDPTGATVRRDGSDLGDTPLDLRIPRGERWTIEISREGYLTRQVTLQGGQPRLTVHLEPVAEEAPEARPTVRRPTAPPAPVPLPQVRPFAPIQPAPTPPPRRTGPTPDLDDPWAR
ncbi:MAG: serine/threonine protein kinase [Sandaracinaceae bacterium]|nr:serine/threonine protein kinase [Sandaracinaceae bacterium]